MAITPTIPAAPAPAPVAEALATPGPPVPRPPPPSAVRPEIQALRALAVALVVVYHLWPSSVPGGFIGVDVFFAISGFLITSLLLREIDRTGSLSLAGFWARRARRILPAALLTVGVCAAATALFVPLNYWPQFFGEMRASTEYIQNWHLASSAVDYFKAEDGPSPVQHFWSLSAEEQFYLVWPVLMVVAIALTRRRPARAKRWAIGVVMGGLTAASLAYSLVHTAADPAAAYFITPTRAWEFGAGGLLALLPQATRSPAAVRSVVSWAGLAAIMLAAFAFTDATPFPGFAAALPVLGALAVIGAGAPERRWAPSPVLVLPPVQFLGDISYSVYLWHWPLLVLAPFVVHRAVTGGALLVVLMLTILISWLSKRLVEDPVRAQPFLVSRRTGWTFGVAALATAAVFAATSTGTSFVQAQIRRDARVTSRTLAHRPACFGAASRDPEKRCNNPRLARMVVPSPVQAPKMRNSPCPLLAVLGRVRPCSFGAAPAQAKKTIALVGDSHASHWRAAVDVVARGERWRGVSITHTSCPLSAAVPDIVEPDRTRCRQWNRQIRAWFGRHPEVSIVFVGEHSGGQVLARSGRDQMAAQVAGYRAAWRSLPASVKHVIVLRDTPKMHSGTLACVQDALAHHRRAGTSCAVARRDALSRDPAMAAAARMHSRRVQTVDLTRFLCDAGRCFPVIGGALVYKDIHHFTTVFATTLGPYLERRVDALRATW